MSDSPVQVSPTAAQNDSPPSFDGSFLLGLFFEIFPWRALLRFVGFFLALGLLPSLFPALGVQAGSPAAWMLWLGVPLWLAWPIVVFFRKVANHDESEARSAEPVAEHPPAEASPPPPPPAAETTALRADEFDDEIIFDDDKAHENPCEVNTVEDPTAADNTPPESTFTPPEGWGQRIVEALEVGALSPHASEGELNNVLAEDVTFQEFTGLCVMWENDMERGRERALHEAGRILAVAHLERTWALPAVPQPEGSPPH